MCLPFNGVQSHHDVCKQVFCKINSLLRLIHFLLITVGWPEIAVIGVVVALVFGPSNIAGLGKDLGKLAGSIKKEVSCNTVHLFMEINVCSGPLCVKLVRSYEKKIICTSFVVRRDVRNQLPYRNVVRSIRT